MDSEVLQRISEAVRPPTSDELDYIYDGMPSWLRSDGPELLGDDDLANLQDYPMGRGL